MRMTVRTNGTANPTLPLWPMRGIARFPSGSEQWVAVLQATDEDALRLNRLDVSRHEADTAARLWAKVAAWVESDQIAYYIDDRRSAPTPPMMRAYAVCNGSRPRSPRSTIRSRPPHRVGGSFSNDFASVRHPIAHDEP